MPNKPMVSVDVKQHFYNNLYVCFGVKGGWWMGGGGGGRENIGYEDCSLIAP